MFFLKNKSFIISSVTVLLLGSLLYVGSMVNAEVKAEKGIFVDRVQPGEILPVSLELSNFGTSDRIDVNVHYDVFDESEDIAFSFEETVAVETSAQFIKDIVIPSNLDNGKYRMEVSLMYQGQVAPAVASFNFYVEDKIFGLFVEDFIKYILGIIAVAIFIVFVYYLHVRSKLKASKLSLFDYKDVPDKRRIYFELISDILTKMRLEHGQEVIKLANTVSGLTVNKKDGKVLKVDDDPALIVAGLIKTYESKYNKRINFMSSRMGSRKSALNKGLISFRK